MSSKFPIDLDTLRRGLAEFSASAMLLCLGCIGCIHSELFQNNNLQKGLNFGLVVLACFQCFHCVSGAHINPCISIAAIIVGEVSWKIALMYILCQFLGAFVGFGFAKLIAPSIGLMDNKFCITIPELTVSVGSAIGFEFVLTSTWVFAMCAAWDQHNVANQDSLPLRIGLIVSCLTITGGYFTGASMNPFRSLAPAVINGMYKKVWIYIVGPLLAAFTMPFAWRFLYAIPAKKDSIINA